MTVEVERHPNNHSGLVTFEDGLSTWWQVSGKGRLYFDTPLCPTRYNEAAAAVTKARSRALPGQLALQL